MMNKLATTVIQLFCFADKPMKRGGNLRKGRVNPEKGGILEKRGMNPLPTMENFFSCSDKESQKSRAKAKKLGKRYWITTLWENDPNMMKL